MNPLQKYAEIPPFVESGYEPKTTFWGDFGVADVFVLNKMEPGAVEDTFKRAFKQYKDDKEYGTELAMVLNLKCWEHHDKGNTKLSELYSKLFYKLQDYVYDNWDDEDKHYYHEITN